MLPRFDRMFKAVGGAWASDTSRLQGSPVML